LDIEGREADMSDANEGTILLDLLAGDGEAFETSFLEKIGHPVVVCHGPAPHATCPIVGGADCPKFDEAHGIVFELDLDRPQHRAILARYRDLAAPDVPIKVVVTADQAERYRDLVDRVEVWVRPPTASDLDGFAAEVEAVDRQAEHELPETWIG
jgi:hypothetical protein